MKKGIIKLFANPAMLLAMFALCFISCVAVKPNPVNAASKKVKLTLEFTDGSKKSWTTGDPKISLGNKKLAYVYFGSYPQKEVTGGALTSKITGAKYNKSGVATVAGVKYKRISKEDITNPIGDYISYYWPNRTYAYFEYSKIKWRVLSFQDGKAFLLSEYGLDNQEYNNECKITSWAKCSLRSWLNKDFYSAAFSSAEKKLIKKTTVKAIDNSLYGTDAGSNTSDKLFLLSLSDILNKKYGFSGNANSEDINRRCAATDFAFAMGTYRSRSLLGIPYATSNGLASCYWWLRTPGDYLRGATNVYDNGSVDVDGYDVDIKNTAVRPALRLNLSSVIK